MKKSNDTIGNRTRDLPACSAVPQPTAPPHTPDSILYTTIFVCGLSPYQISCDKLHWFFVAIKPRAEDRIATTAMLLFYIIKNVNKTCLLYKCLLLCMYIRYLKWRVWLLTHTFARSPFYYWIATCRKLTRQTVYMSHQPLGN